MVITQLGLRRFSGILRAYHSRLGVSTDTFPLWRGIIYWSNPFERGTWEKNAMVRTTSKAAQSVVLVVVLMIASRAWADVESGPAVGAAVPALVALGITGDVSAKEIDFVAERAQKPTLYVFIPAERWGRPPARLLRELDKQMADAGGDAYLVAVWLTDDVEAAKEYLPKAQTSLKLTRSSLTVFPGDKAGPADWAVNSKADVTVVVAAKGKVAARFGFVSANETVAEQVATAWKAAVEK